MVLALTGCYGMAWLPLASRIFSPTHGSTMFFVQGLKWSADDSSDELTLDITLHTAKERCVRASARSAGCLSFQPHLPTPS